MPKVGLDRSKTGRKKGTPNKATAAVKEAIIEAFERSGGVDYLVTIAKDDPRTFCTLLGKVIPMQVDGELKHGLSDPLLELMERIAANGKRVHSED